MFLLFYICLFKSGGRGVFSIFHLNYIFVCFFFAFFLICVWLKYEQGIITLVVNFMIKKHVDLLIKQTW